MKNKRTNFLYRLTELEAACLNIEEAIYAVRADFRAIIEREQAEQERKSRQTASKTPGKPAEIKASGGAAGDGPAS